MKPNATALTINTKNYEAMKQFFVDLGIDVSPEHPQIPSMNNGGRAVIVDVPSLAIALEECTDTIPTGPFYLEIVGVDESRLLAMKGKYSVKQIRHQYSAPVTTQQNHQMEDL